MKTNFYEFSQNNSGGHFQVDDKLCHRVVIEANTEEDAIEKAEDLGCYWNGVEEEWDCPCCGDRWYSPDIIDLEKINNKGYEVLEWKEQTEEGWYKEYEKYEIVEKPVKYNAYNSTYYKGKIKFRNMEEYFQYMADTYLSTTPAARIFYLNGKVKEIYKNEL